MRLKNAGKWTRRWQPKAGTPALINILLSPLKSYSSPFPSMRMLFFPLDFFVDG